ncbi:unnamed protein product, partial [Callosobruchus maculatus]
MTFAAHNHIELPTDDGTTCHTDDKTSVSWPVTCRDMAVLPCRRTNDGKQNRPVKISAPQVLYIFEIYYQRHVQFL